MQPLRTNRTHMYKRIKTLKMPTLSENGLVPWKALHTYAIGSKRRRRLHAAAATTPPPRRAALRRAYGHSSGNVVQQAEGPGRYNFTHLNIFF